MLQPEGFNECAAKRGGARLRWRRQRLTCIRCLYFKLGPTTNAPTRASGAGRKYLLRQLHVSPGSTLIPSPSSMRASAIGFREAKMAEEGEGFASRESEDHGSRRARKGALMHNLRQRETARQQATESALTFDLSGVPKARPLEGRVSRLFESEKAGRHAFPSRYQTNFPSARVNCRRT